jgi:hypothetical protein
MVPKVRLAAGLMAILLIAPRYSAGQRFALDFTRGLQPHRVTVEAVTYQGYKAVRMMLLPSEDGAGEANKTGSGGGIATVSDTTFHNGTNEMEIAGKPPNWCAG